jgi:hypothetical protein
VNDRYHDRILPTYCRACWANKRIMKDIMWEEGTLKICDECWAESLQRRRRRTQPGQLLGASGDTLETGEPPYAAEEGKEGSL